MTIDPAAERIAVDARLEEALGELVHLHLNAARFQTTEQAIKACIEVVQHKIRDRHQRGAGGRNVTQGALAL